MIKLVVEVDIMKLITYKFENEEKIGVLKEDKVFEIANYQTMIDVIQGNDALQMSEKNVDLSQIELMSPIPHPIRNIICLGINYIEHASEMENKVSESDFVPSFPIYFSKMTNEIIGSEMDVESYFNMSKTLDYEVELAIIIGKKGTDISEEEAKDYIFGYSISNDFSMREFQVDHLQWFKGKSLDTHTTLGPVILTADEVEYPPSLDIKAYVNDELRQSSKTDHLIFDINHMIHVLSKGTTLLPGDIILTGTPAGVGMGYTPPIYLVPGDIVKCEIEKIGELVNYIK